MGDLAGHLIIYSGLPASGKSTHAADRILHSRMSSEDVRGWIVRVNQDEIRKELGWTDWNSWDFAGLAESRVQGIKRQRIEDALRQGRTVISDDTNLKKRYILQLTALAEQCNATVTLHRMNTPIEECIRRDQLRGPACVGEKVIRKMAGDWARELDPADQPFFPKVKPRGLPKAVICDLDGTISLFDEKGHRGPYDASRCDEDECNLAVKRALIALARMEGWTVIYLSGRYDSFRPQTERFLADNMCPSGPLYMRAVGDSRIDWLVKGELFDRYVRPHFDVQVCLDDRDQVVKFWRGIGLQCWQVAEGNF